MQPNDMVAKRIPSDPANNGPTEIPATQQPAPAAAGSTSSAATTVTNEDPSNNNPEQPLTAMELAYEELKRTIHEAASVRQARNVRARLIQSHIEALNEDSALVASFETPSDEMRAKATQLVLQARRLKRHLERDLIDHDIADDENVNHQIMQVVPFDEPKTSGMKLAPLKPPTFNGDTAQFRIFKDFFEENVLNNAQLTDTAKWLRLSESLIGQPAELISEIPKTSHTLVVAWKLLLDIYGDDRPIVQLYERLQKLPPATNVTSTLRMVHSKLEGILLSLEHLGHDVSDNGYVRWIYMSKFPVDVAYQVQKSKNISLASLRVAIAELLQARECVDQHSGTSNAAIAYPATTPRSAINPTFEKKKPAPTSSGSTNTRPLRCVFCTGEHWNDVCTVYPSLEARRERLTGKCFICLRKQHVGLPCTTLRRCFHCDSLDHNRALCPTKFQEPIQQPIVQAAVIGESSRTQATGYFLTFMAQASSKFVTEPIQLRVVVDTAGGSTVIRREVAQLLKIPALKESTTYTGLGDAKLISSFKLQEMLQLIPTNGPPINIEAEMVDYIIPDVPTANVQQFRQQYPQYSNTVIPPTGEGEPVDLLIGSNMLVDLLSPEKIIAVDAQTLLMPTKFGSLILGRGKRQQEQVCHSLLFNILQNPIAQLCNLDLVGLAGLHSSDVEEEQRAIQYFYDTVRFLEGRYFINWPWRCFPPQLDSNFGLALGRLRTLYRRLQHTPKLLQDYHNIIQQQLKDDIIEKVDLTLKTLNFTHYLPHHPVLQPGKSTSVRPVYDGSSKTGKTRKSLNDNILKGKNWLNDLLQTLIRFRRFQNVATADIAKAFHQIGINENDRDVVRFIWLKDPTQPPTDDNLQIYRFKRVAFGIVASPFILYATIQHHAKQQQPSQFMDTLIKNLYADNLVVALEDDIEPTQFYDCAKQFFNSMKMNLTKWSSNSATLIQHIPESDQLTEVIQSVLGLNWNRHTDILSIKSPRLQADKIQTRRTVARQMAAYFDPMGWATPIILLAKTFFRKIWTETEKWDEPLTEKNTAEWAEISTKLKGIENIHIPRYFNIHGNTQKIQLHAFVDASVIAYAVVVYIRIQSPTQNHVMLISSKSRLTPAKTMTIPKLELIAILLGSRYVDFVKKALQLPHQIETFVWSDSKCALSWLRQDKILPTVVEKYINEAKTYNISQYRYVPSEHNFADVATRGAEYSTLLGMQWWTGPAWLHSDTTWPINDSCSDPENKVALIFQNKLMTKQIVVHEDTIDGVATINIKNFSSLTSLLKRTAFALLAATKFRKHDFLNLQTEVDVAMAEKLWLKWDQSRIYAIQNEPGAGKQFTMRNISVFRDTEGLIRCATRITNSVMELDAVSPILLVKNSKLTELVVLHTHQMHKHVGTNHTLAALRQKYWLPHGRQQVYKIILRSCYKCRRQLAQIYPTPQPAPLPEFRVVRTQKPFQAVGVDVFGPFAVRHMETTGYIKQKRWVIIFTCATIRAIHLEVIAEMTTEEISHAFRQFVARRGVPKMFISDNAPQFHALDGYFQSIWHAVNKAPAVSNYFAENQIIWKFTTELAPWMGGIYERLIQSIKSSFEKTYGMKTLVSRQFNTAMVEIEAVLNARPIAYVEQDPEMSILTPNDFLMAKHVAIPIAKEPYTNDDVIKKLWKSSQAYLNEFWKSWANQYLMLLRERNDQLRDNRQAAKYEPRKGDVVIMQELSKKRSHWQLAVVERLIPSQDRIVRSVQVRIPNGSRLVRPVITLAPLQIKMDLPDVRDEQLNVRRDAIIVWPREGASQADQNANEQQLDIEEELGEERNTDEDEM